MRIGIFGGSFNPPHLMHKKIALALLEKHYVDRVIYVPTGNQYQKKDLIDVKYRYHMLEKMIQPYKNLSVSDYEMGTLKYTYQTLDHFQKIYPNDEIYFICGTDNLKEITTWRRYDHILSHYPLLVIQRNQDDCTLIQNQLQESHIIATDIVAQDISSTKIRKYLLEEKNEKLATYIDENVLEYIKENNLYGG